MIISDQYVPMKLFTQGSIADHQLNGHVFEQTPGDSEGQGSLACCSLWGCRVRHNWATEPIDDEQLMGDWWVEEAGLECWGPDYSLVAFFEVQTFCFPIYIT